MLEFIFEKQEKEKSPQTFPGASCNVNNNMILYSSLYLFEITHPDTETGTGTGVSSAGTEQVQPVLT